MDPVIELDGLEVRFGQRVILNKLSAALTGVSIGLLGFHKPASGTARVLGRDIRTHGREVRGLVGYMPESDSFLRSGPAVMLRLSVALLSLAMAPMASATLVSVQSLSTLQGADLIAVGTASGVFQPGSGVFTLSVARVVSGGPALGGQSVFVNWANKAAGAPNTAAEKSAAGTGLWFLRLSPSGWLLMPVVNGDVPMVMTYIPEPSGALPSAYVYSASTPLADRVASEVCAAFESLGGAYNFQLYRLVEEQFDGLSRAIVPGFYQRMVNSGVQAQQIIGLSGQIRNGSLSALAAAAQDASSFAAAQLEYGILIRAIKNQLRPTDPATLAVLGQAADNASGPSLFREAAARALAAVHSLPTLPYLAALFADPDANLQNEAVRGIGSFANGLPAQTPQNVATLAYLQPAGTAPYRTSTTQAHFALGPGAIGQLSFWQQWWSQNRAALGF